MDKECFALMNMAAFRLFMRVIQKAVYEGPLDKNSTEIKEMYDFLESTNCTLRIEKPK